MTVQTQRRICAIRHRTKQCRKRQNDRAILSSSVACMSLLAGIGVLLRIVHPPGRPWVSWNYGTVLLRNAAGAYIAVGVMAFVAGATLTILCMRLKTKTIQSHKYEEEGKTI